MSAAAVRSGIGPQAFFIQYLSLILIILTIIAGTFTRRSFPVPEKVKPPAHAQRLIVPNHRAGWISDEVDITAQLDNSRQALPTHLVAAWKEILRNHDIGLWLQINVPYGDEMTMGVIEALSEQLHATGIPASALDIHIRSSNQGQGNFSLRQRWFKWQDS